jgi:hypothetical protein
LYVEVQRQRFSGPRHLVAQGKSAARASIDSWQLLSTVDKMAVEASEADSSTHPKLLQLGAPIAMKREHAKLCTPSTLIKFIALARHLSDAPKCSSMPFQFLVTSIRNWNVTSE